ncbi:extracellular solute-binding protein [Paenibacillus chungangensis]|uniref:Extracellular solute-binding protein n=1 Tax=Paenibacillus chungangensis TaxID=696535 RepID=A0ABW3HUQ3_9BACL
MRHFSKKGKVSIVMCILLLLLAACANNSEGDNSTSVKETDDVETKPVKLVFVSNDPVNNNRPGDVQDKVHEIILEKLGVDLNAILPATRDEVSQRINLMLSSGQQLDYFKTQMAKALELYKNDAIVPLNDLLDQHGENLKKAIPTDLWDKATVDGKIIGIPSIPQNTTPNVLQIRTDWLENLNLPMPKTIADYENVMDQFVNADPDQNGKQDTYALNAGNGGTIEELERAFGPFFMEQGMEWWQDEQGKLLPPEMNPAYKDMMAKFMEWNNKGYIWPEMILSKRDSRVKAIANNKIGSVAGWYTSTIVGGLEVLVKSVPEANYVPILLQGSGINKLDKVPVDPSVVVITKSSSNPEAVMKFFDFAATREGFELTTLGIEGESYKKLPNELTEYIGEAKNDWNKAKYYYLYAPFTYVKFEGVPPWTMDSWLESQYRKVLDLTEQLPSFQAVDYNVVYDKSQWSSFSKLNDLDTYLLEQKVKVFLGEVPLSDWDTIITKWNEIGGNQMIEDRNAQFNAFKK